MTQPPAHPDPQRRIRELEQEVQRLRASQERWERTDALLRLITENVTDAIWIRDLDMRLTYMSPAIERIRGFSVEEAMRQSLEEALTPESAAVARSGFLEEMAREERGENDPARWRRMELEMTRKDGSTVWTEMSLSFIRDADSRAVGVVGVTREITDRKAVEDARRVSELKFRSIFDFSPHPISLTSAETGRIVDVNDRLCHVAGYAREELLGKTTTEMGFYSARERALFIGQLQESGEVRDLEMTFRVRDGSARTTLMFARRLLVAEQPFLLTQFLDITERKRAEAAQAESERRYRHLFENAPIGIFTSSSQGRALSVNNAMAHMLGCGSPAQALASYGDLGSTLYIDPVQRTEFLRALRDEGRVENFDTQVHAVDGRTVWLRVSARIAERSEDGSFTIEGFTTDITEGKRAEEALRERQHKYQLLADNTLDCIWLLNMDLVFTYINPAIEAMAGFTPEEWIGSKLSDHCTPERFEQMSRLVVESLERLPDISPICFETEMLHKDGSSLSLEILTKVITDPHGNPIGLQGTTRDISARKRAEEEKERLQAQLTQSQKMESVGRLAGGVAHDFNNMLSIIQGHAEIALGRVGPADPLHADLEAIHRAAGRSADLTRQLLAFARRQTAAPRLLELNRTVASMLGMLERLIGEDIDLAWKPGRGLWPVRVDPSQVDQILANLCVNARDAIDGVGKVTIETDNRVVDEAYCAAHAGCIPGQYVLLAVSDNGSGMDPETLSHLFEPFFTTKEVGRGTGLGLATVYGIVQQNDGFVNVYSEPGRGTTFRVYLPRHEAETAPLPEQAPARAPERGGETLLLVEDDPALLRMTTAMLEGFGYTVLPAGTPAEAIRLAESHPGRIDLLVTDVVMPEMNGRDLAEAVLSLYPNVKALFMSGYTANIIAHHGVLDEGVSFLQKPFSMADLAAKVRQALGRA